MLYLVRHGKTIANANGLYAGQQEYPLSSEGEQQARRIGASLAATESSGRPLSKIMTSPLSRAGTTAQIICSQLVTDRIEVVPSIIEVNYGSLDGRSIDELKVSFLDESIKGGGNYGVEPYDDVMRRARAFLALVSPYTSGIESAVAVGHGTMWRFVRAEFLGTHPGNLSMQNNDEFFGLANGSEAAFSVN